MKKLYQTALFFFLFELGIGLSILLKNDLSWDFLNYHYYNAFAFLNDRIGYDISPASINTFFNPLLDLPLYFYIQKFNDNLSLIYALQGLWTISLLVAFFMIWRLFFEIKTGRQYFLFGFISLLCLTGQATFYQIGSSTNEVTVASFVLWGLYVLLQQIKFPLLQRIWKFFLAGLIMGIGLGFKQTIVTYCIAAGLSLIICYKYLNKPFKSIFFFALGGLVGYFIINGYFMWTYWELYQNPFFPFLNGIFHSPYFDNLNYSDVRFLPTFDWSPKNFLIYPFFWNTWRYSNAEISYIDFRLMMLYVLLIFVPFYFVFSKRIKIFVKEKHLETSFFIFMFLSFFVWMFIFCILRYSVVLEVLSVVLFAQFMAFVFHVIHWRAFRVFFLLLMISILFVPIFGHGWNHKIRDRKYINIEKINIPENTLLKIYSIPGAGLIPEFSKKANIRAVGYAQYNCTHQRGTDFAEREEFRKMRDKIEKEHKGPVIAVFYDNSMASLDDFEMRRIKRSACENAKKRGKIPEKVLCSLSPCETWNAVEDALFEDLGNNFYCRLLKNNLEKQLQICVPKDLKEQILTGDTRTNLN